MSASFSLARAGGHARQGIPADAARPPHLCHDHRRAGDAADAVRLRHQHRPQGLPTALVAHDTGPLARSLAAAHAEHRLLPHRAQPATEVAGGAPAGTGEVQFVLVDSRRFSQRAWCAAKGPPLLVAADATDPAAAGNAIAALAQLVAAGAGARSRKAAGRGCSRARRRSRCACTAATTRKA